LIKDTQITEALNAANKAQDTADGKMEFYSVLPSSGMQEGDLLIPTADIVSGSGTTAVTYKAGKIYRYIKDKGWIEVVYSQEL
jgi:hypothetical protein